MFAVVGSTNSGPREAGQVPASVALPEDSAGADGSIDEDSGEGEARADRQEGGQVCVCSHPKWLDISPKNLKNVF